MSIVYEKRVHALEDAVEDLLKMVAGMASDVVNLQKRVRELERDRDNCGVPGRLG